MPRLTNPTYLHQRKQLFHEWSLEGGGAFVLLSPTEQITLHDFYAFTKHLSDEQAIAHRKAVTAAQPSLPQRAGKAVARLAIFVPKLAAYRRTRQRVRAPKREKGAPYVVRVFSDVNPEIDPERLAKILIHMMEEDLRKRREEGESDQAA